jgi:hypothetical protein
MGGSRFHSSVCRILIAGALVAAVGSTVGEEKVETTPRPFDAHTVAKLSHEAYKVAWDTKFWARRDLRIAAFRPTKLDWEAVEFLEEISRKVPWVARDIEKHRTTARASSKRSSDFVRYDAMMLRKRYQPTSFQKSTAQRIEKLLGMLDEMMSYYDEKGGTK